MKSYIMKSQRTEQQLTKRNLEEKKMKKRIHARKNAQKYGRNVYGERCIVKEITIQKEAANKQCIEIVKDIRDHAAKGLKL